MNDIVSIIIPVYNAELFLGRCIKSIINQDYPYWELILINDGSTDNSVAIIDQYAKKDNRIKYINKSNEGVSVARNIGINNANGKWICFIDSDDYIEQNYISNFLRYLSKSKNDIIVFCGIRYEDSQGNEYYNDTIPNQIIEAEKLKYYDKYNILLNGYPWNKIYNTQIIRKNYLKFDESISLGEDHGFVLSYLSHISEIVLDNTKTYHYVNQNQESLSRKKRCPEEYINSAVVYLNGLDLFCEHYSIDFNSKFVRTFNSIYGVNFFIRALRLIDNKNYKNIIYRIKSYNGYIDKYKCLHFYKNWALLNIKYGSPLLNLMAAKMLNLIYKYLKKV